MLEQVTDELAAVPPYTGVGQGGIHTFDPGGREGAGQQPLTSTQACPGGQDALLVQAVPPGQVGGGCTHTTFPSADCAQMHMVGPPQSVSGKMDDVQADVVDAGHTLLTGKHRPSWQT